MVGTGILEFCRRFPDEDACLRWIFDRKFGDHSPCPACGEFGKWLKVRGTKSFLHSCRARISPLKDTAFYRSNLTLTSIFYAILLFANSSSGIRTPFLRKHLGLGLSASHRLSNRVRLHMSAHVQASKLGGPGKLVEVDEVLLRHVRYPNAARFGAVLVQGLACDGQVRMGIVADRTRKTLHRNICRFAEPGSTIVTDDWPAYKGLESCGFRHITVNHSKGYFNENGYSTGQIDSHWASVRRAMRGYHQVAPKNMWLFLAEISCRYNLRRSPVSVFDHIIAEWPSISPDRITELEVQFDWRKPLA